MSPVYEYIPGDGVVFVLVKHTFLRSRAPQAALEPTTPAISDRYV
jgi:hypothetical protein